MRRFAYCHLCDDIRREVHNRYSLMGIWGARHTFSAYPVTIPVFSAAVYLRTEPDDHIDEVTVKIVGPGDMEVHVDMDLSAAPDHLPDDHPYRTTVLHLQIPGLRVENPGRMEVYVVLPDEELLAGSVLLQGAQAEDREVR